MKNNKLTSLIIIGISILSACSSGDDIEKKQEKLKKLRDKSIELNKEIKALTLDLDTLTSGTKAKTYTPVKVTPVALSEFTHNITVQGYVEASNNILINSEVPATIVKLLVREGQKVSKGQTLAILNTDVIDKNIKELEGNLNLARIVFEKQNGLQKQNIGTEIQYLEAKNRKEALENSLATLQTNRAKYIIKSPIVGYVDDLLVKAGEMANPAMPLARIVNSDNILIKADVSEAMLGKIEVGDYVDVNFPSINFNSKGKIVQNGQFIDPQNRTFKILIDLDKKNSLLKPNLMAVIKISDYKNNSVISVPSGTVQEDLKGQYVYLLNKDETVAKKYVETGKFSDDNLEIIKGLKAGDFMVTVGQRNIATGEKVTVVK